MKWDLLYDEGSGKPYRKFDDWYEEVRFLKVHVEILLSMIIAALIIVTTILI